MSSSSATPATPALSWRDILLTALAPAIWGSTYIVTSELLPPDRPFTAALIRVLPAGLLLSQSMTGLSFAGLLVVLASVLVVQWSAARGA